MGLWLASSVGDIAGLSDRNTIHEVLDISVAEATPDRVVLEMPINHRVHQPFGLLHGGASAVLAESAASIGAFLNCDTKEEIALGVELNISHLRARSDGTLRAVADPARRGRSLHVWKVDLTDENGEMVASARCTLAIRKLAEVGAAERLRE